jgi:hypothetical protein
MMIRGAKNRSYMTRRVLQVDRVQPLKFNGNMLPSFRFEAQQK